MRPIVVVKTHAATGQRTTAGNVKSVVWDTSPLHGSARDQATKEETDDGHLTTVTVSSHIFCDHFEVINVCSRGRVVKAID